GLAHVFCGRNKFIFPTGVSHYCFDEEAFRCTVKLARGMNEKYFLTYPEPCYGHRMAALGASQHNHIAAGNTTQIRVQKCRQRHAISLTTEAVAKTVKETFAIVVIGGMNLR